jgi:hypothetical protein
VIEITAKPKREKAASQEAFADRGARLTPARLLAVLGSLFLALCVVAIVSAAIGSERVAVGELARIVIARLSGGAGLF